MRIRTSVVPILAFGLLAGSAVGVAAQDEAADPSAPTWVTGSMVYLESCWGAPAAKTDDGVVIRRRGVRCEPMTWESSDPRLGGSAVVTENADVYRVDGEYYTVSSTVIDVGDESGGWRCTIPDGLDIGGYLLATGQLTCVGHGGNEGHTAILAHSWTGSERSIEGLIFAGELPPVPEPMEPPAE
jgi:hypothetical protein